ncbi:MAG: right-handed parallel beta-helix repeat-containing protein, partial [Wenzhouxiangella sp.]|nr:right-handed parallel beta-helix repeat-containing protein [Wenzhouxiangella sp.]
VMINGGSLAHQIERNLIESHGSTGIELRNTSGAIALIDNTVQSTNQGLWLNNASGNLQIEDNQFIGNNGFGLYVSTQPRTGNLSNNTLTGNASGPVFLEPNASASVIPLDNTLDGPVYVGGGTLTVDATWNDLHTYFLSSLTVGAGVTWTLPPGVIVKMPFNTALGVNGQLVVEGTAAEPVYITEQRDDSVGDYSEPGDPGPGRWTGLVINDGGVANIDHLRLRYASRSIGIISASIVVNDGGLLNLSDSIIRLGGIRGVMINGGSLAHQIERNLIETHGSSGIELINTSGAVALIDNEVQLVSGPGINLNNAAAPVLVQGNRVLGGSGHGMLISSSGLPLPDEGEAPVIELIGNRIRAQAQDGMHIINSRVRIERNQLAENQGAGIRLSGESTSPDLFSNWVSGNAGGGIDIVDQANPLVGGTRENGNDIVGNAPFGLRSQNTQVTVLARCNWWGHPSGPSQDPENPDGQGDVILGPGSVDASPYLVESAIDALFLDRFEAQLLAQGDGC